MAKHTTEHVVLLHTHGVPDDGWAALAGIALGPYDHVEIPADLWQVLVGIVASAGTTPKRCAWCRRWMGGRQQRRTCSPACRKRLYRAAHH
jgi:hypothetical protein